MDHYNFDKEVILFLYAVAECDKTSTFFNKGKVKVLKLFQTLQTTAAKVFTTENCSVEDIFKHGFKFILAIYGVPKQEVSINNYRTYL